MEKQFRQYVDQQTQGNVSFQGFKAYLETQGDSSISHVQNLSDIDFVQSDKSRFLINGAMEWIAMKDSPEKLLAYTKRKQLNYTAIMKYVSANHQVNPKSLQMAAVNDAISRGMTLSEYLSPKKREVKTNQSREVLDEWVKSGAALEDKEGFYRFARTKFSVPDGFHVMTPASVYAPIQKALKGQGPYYAALKYSKLTQEQRAATNMPTHATEFNAPRQAVSRWITSGGTWKRGDPEAHNRVINYIEARQQVSTSQSFDATRPIDVDHPNTDTHFKLNIKQEAVSPPLSPEYSPPDSPQITNEELGYFVPVVKTEPGLSPEPTAAEPIEANLEPKQETPKILHSIDNAAPILQGDNGEDLMLKVFQPLRKSQRTDDLNELIDRQKITGGFSIMNALADHPPLSTKERREKVKRLNDDLLESIQRYLKLPTVERLQHIDSTLLVSDAGEIGRGVKAARPLEQFEAIVPYAGKYLDTPEAIAAEKERVGEKDYDRYVFGTQLQHAEISGFGEGIGNVSSLINEANKNRPQDNNLSVIMLGKRLPFFVATRDIPAGEDLLFDYGERYDRRGWQDYPLELSSDESGTESDADSNRRKRHQPAGTASTDEAPAPKKNDRLGERLAQSRQTPSGTSSVEAGRAVDVADIASRVESPTMPAAPKPIDPALPQTPTNAADPQLAKRTASTAEIDPDLDDWGGSAAKKSRPVTPAIHDGVKAIAETAPLPQLITEHGSATPTDAPSLPAQATNKPPVGVIPSKIRSAVLVYSQLPDAEKSRARMQLLAQEHGIKLSSLKTFISPDGVFTRRYYDRLPESSASAISKPTVRPTSESKHSGSSSRRLDLLRQWVNETSDIYDTAAARKFLTEHGEVSHAGVYQLLDKLVKIKKGEVGDIYKATEEYLALTGVQQSYIKMADFARARNLNVFDLSKQLGKRRAAMQATTADASVPQTPMRNLHNSLAVEEWALQAVEMRDKEDARSFVKSKGLPIDIGFEQSFSNLQATLDGKSPRAIAIRFSQLTPEQQSAIGLKKFSELFNVNHSTVRNWISPTGEWKGGSAELNRKLATLLPFDADSYINVSAPPLISLEPGGSSPTRGEEVGGADTDERQSGVDVESGSATMDATRPSMRSKGPLVAEQELADSPPIKSPSGSIDISSLQGGLAPHQQSTWVLSGLLNAPGKNASVVGTSRQANEPMVNTTAGSRLRATSRNYELAKKYVETPLALRPTLKAFAGAENVSRSNLYRWITADGTWRKGPYAKSAPPKSSETAPSPPSRPDPAAQILPTDTGKPDSNLPGADSLGEDQ